MLIKIAQDRKGLGKISASLASDALRSTLEKQARARLVVATGSSQFETLESLIQEPGIDWSRVDGFHLDEYLGLRNDHPASFCGYLAKRFVELVPIGSFHYLDGTRNPSDTIRDASTAWNDAPIDIALIGIGENGHLAFNDPPANFETKEIYHVVDLDLACRQQQVGEGWFATIGDCPARAISMTIHGILASNKIICSVPDSRKSEAVRQSVEGPIMPEVPGSILQKHHDVTLVLDQASASRLQPATIAAAHQ